MTYLNQSKFIKFIEEYFSEEKEKRMVGVDCSHDSCYCDIIRFFGEEQIDPLSIKIRHLDVEFEFQDKNIKKFSNIIAEELRSEGRLYDGPHTMKLSSFKSENDCLVMTVQPIAYGDAAGSCFALDLENKELFGDSLTLRNYYKERNRDGKIEDNLLGISFGVCGILCCNSSPHRFLRVRRSSKLAALSGSYGPSVAGSIDYDTEDRNLSELIVRHLTREVNEELNLKSDEFEVIPLAYGREIYRGERPQLFALIKTNLSESDLNERIIQLSEEVREFDQFEFLDINQSDLDLNIEAMMNLQMVLEYYSIKKPS